MNTWLRKWWWILPLLVLLGGYWLLPISGQVVIIPGGDPIGLLWPQMRLSPPAPAPGQEATLRVTDGVPWSYVLLTVDGQPAQAKRWPTGPDDALVWEWKFVVPEDGGCTLVFYRDCHTGCIERGRMTIGTGPPAAQTNPLPTKLGLVFANPERDWHGRSGWNVELTYALMAEEEHWGIDDLAARVHQAAGKGLRVLVRVDYDYGQSLPPAGDYLALSQYLQYLQRLARDERLRDVYGYFLGSSYNSLDSNSLAPAHPVTPEWYARVFNGYGEEIAHADNAVQVMRADNPHVRVLVGPVQPWTTDQDGEQRYEIDAPWLNYANTLIAALDEGARAKAATGIPLTAPDGFAVQAAGRPAAPELAGRDADEEPRLDLKRGEWNGAQAGFRVYREWLDIVNAYSTTRGLPVYLTVANTFAPDESVPPAQNYPRGWLTAALGVINEEPQIKALCWFLDYFPHDTQWEYFSLTRQPGRLLDAAEEFDLLLKGKP
ncbi:MAG: hypothetical protein DRJ03_03150 [Chloroflexi bacterium]|nr:MAG: hypothetical protein DRJ03_03150 [Chloroflexota bacterium]